MAALNENDFFREVTLRICGNLNIETALWQCFDYMRSMVPLDEISLHVYDRTAGVLTTIAAATKEGGRFFKLPPKIKLSTEGMSELKKVLLPEVMIVNRPESDPVTKEMGSAHGKLDSSVLVMRLVIAGANIGALTLRADGTDRYTEEHGHLLRALNEPFAIALSNSMRYQEVLALKESLSDDNRYLHQELRQITGEEVVGGDFGLRKVMELVRQVAPLSSPVLLLGETGTGKEVIANAIHYSSPRKDAPFIKVNCGAIPDSLVDSELFGHEKGAFTGATSQKRGRFERADGGTLFLDEIGELPLNSQVDCCGFYSKKRLTG
jgi:transcriptional regulator with GAF, ATPase, and Fis domain